VNATGRAEKCEQRIRTWLGNKAAEYLGQTKRHWNSAGRLAPSQIAILCPWRKDKSSLASHARIAGIPLVQDLNAWRQERGVLFSTTKSFKGMEADAIVLVDIPDIVSANYFDPLDMYVACSRAKHRLTVINTSSDGWTTAKTIVK